MYHLNGAARRLESALRIRPLTNQPVKKWRVIQLELLRRAHLCVRTNAGGDTESCFAWDGAGLRDAHLSGGYGHGLPHRRRCHSHPALRGRIQSGPAIRHLPAANRAAFWSGVNDCAAVGKSE